MDNTNLNKPNQNMEMGWDDTIQEDGQELILLDEGDYNFIVTNFERGRFPGGQKIPACNKATITVQIETDKGLSVIKFDLLLYRSVEWRMFYIKKVGLKGELGDSSLDLSTGLNVVIGSSNTGKSIIVECIDYALGDKDYNIELPGYDYHVLPETP